MKNFALSLLFIALVVPLAAAPQEAAAAKPLKPALLVIDIQNAFLPYMAEADKKMTTEIINGVIQLFRMHHLPIIRVYHTDPAWGPKPGSPEFEFPATIAVKPDDAKVVKNFPSAFKKTDLDKILREKGCNTLFLCGLSATGCVLATYHGAMDLDYDVFMVQDALLSDDAELTRAVQRICHSASYFVLELLLRNVGK